MAKRGNNNLFWWIAAILIVVVGGYFLFGESGPNLDYSQYTYTDDEVTKADATNVIVEYSDFQCPYCGQTAPILKALKTDYDVRVEYKHFPLTSIHPYAQLAAEASECARDQNKFWAYHDVLMANQDYLAKSHLLSHAEGLGLDMDAFNSCINGRAKQVIVAQHVLEGQQVPVKGTPTLLLNGELLQARDYVSIAAQLQ